jgi:hypothetical protein
MNRQRTIATSGLLALAAALVAGAAIAQQGAGYVSNLSGPLFAVKSDGSRRVLSTQSVVSSGDMLVTEDKTYARLRFSDQSEVTLRPSTQFQIENYSFDRQAPDKDGLAFRLFKGALRTVTGLVGRRGNQDAYRLSTATATIGIRGTIFGVTVCLPGTCGGLAPGTYVNVIEGSVALAPPPVIPVVPVPGVVAPPTPPAGARPAAPLVLAQGQFGYVPPAGPPVQLPSDPGVGTITPPASFVTRSEAQPPGTQAPGPSAGPKPSSDCIVR